MTDCNNAERRDQLPDLVHGTLTPAEVVAVRDHLAACAACSGELAVIRAAMALRPQPAVPDVATILRQLPRPATTHRSGVAPSRWPGQEARAQWRAPRAWRMAAGIGVLIAGGWSVRLMRTGSVAMVSAGSSDSVRLAAAAETSRTMPAVAAPVTVAIGSISEYTDEELERLLDRVDRWDGATSAEVSTAAAPILPVSTGGAQR